ncbi:hypothetical protein KIF24_24855 [Micromonospora sp. Llam7]|uniref:hypothetical protein n=1 Tax=Micromonospora tarapacensis TaxID=2835305 RepID=UPI001C82B3FB|nr:hypothetical protein [Micromonospora tarapacensis]MBX7268943.1 hypothetical protein [Micromonospora tarapacensis]
MRLSFGEQASTDVDADTRFGRDGKREAQRTKRLTEPVRVYHPFGVGHLFDHSGGGVPFSVGVVAHQADVVADLHSNGVRVESLGRGVLRRPRERFRSLSPPLGSAEPPGVGER